MIIKIIFILILAFVCTVFAIHSHMEEDEAGNESNIIKNKVIDEVAKDKDRS